MTAFCKSKLKITIRKKIMNKKSIIKYAKIAAIVLVICAVFALLFVGMSKLLDIGNDTPIAVYDGKLVYQSDIEDIVNYHLITQYSSGDSYSDILANAVRTYVRYQLMEQDLAEKGYVLDEDKVEQSFEEAKAKIENIMTYSKWCKTYQVSKKFLKEDIRRQELEKLFYEVTEIEVTEEEARNYYAIHAINDYTRPAGYYWTSVIRPYKDDAVMEEEMLAAKEEMNAYLAKILDGSMTLEEVDEELDEKYSISNGYTYSLYEGEEVTSTSKLIIMEDEAAFRDYLAELDETYATRDPDAEEDSDEYTAYLNYLGKVFQANVYYQLQHMEVGEVCNTALESYAGYYIIRLDAIETVNDFVPFEEVREEIIEILEEEAYETALSQYFTEIEYKYEVQYAY